MNGIERTYGCNYCWHVAICRGFGQIDLIRAFSLLWLGSVQGIWVKPDANGVHQGESAGFQCKVRGSVSHLTVQHWELNGRRVTSTGRVTIEPPDRLVIANSRPDDSGRYTCIAEINGNVYRASQILTVYSKYCILIHYNCCVDWKSLVFVRLILTIL